MTNKYWSFSSQKSSLQTLDFFSNLNVAVVIIWFLWCGPANFSSNQKRFVILKFRAPPMPARQEVAGVTPEVNLLEHVTCSPPPSMNKAAHSGFETQRRHHQKSKTGVSVTSPKGLMSSKIFFKNCAKAFLCRHCNTRWSHLLPDHSSDSNPGTDYIANHGYIIFSWIWSFLWYKSKI